MKQNTKHIVAKEYLIFLRVICGVAILYFAVNASIWVINNNRQSKKWERDMLLSKKDSLFVSKGSVDYFDKAQHRLYSIIHDPEYYTKSFSEFQKQFTPDSTRIKLYNRMIKEKLFIGSYNNFNEIHFPNIDSNTLKSIALLGNQVNEVNRSNLNHINYINWKIPLLCILIICALRFFIISIKNARSTLRNQNGT